MLAFASSVPSTIEVHGIDISDRLFPEPGSYPANLKFSVESITSLPPSWSSQFKFVRQRFLMAGLTRDMWKEALKEMWSVLVPGGWVELTETSLVPGGDGPNVKKASAAVERLFRFKGLVPDPANHLPALIEEAGFVDERMEHRQAAMGRSGGQDGIDMCKNLMSVLPALKASILGLSGGEFGVEGLTSEEEYDAMVSGCEDDWMNSGTHTNYYVFFARKPEE